MASYSGIASNGLLAPSHTTLADLFANYKYESTIGLLYMEKKKADIADVTAAMAKINVDMTDIIGVQRDTEKWFTRLLVKFEDYAKTWSSRTVKSELQELQMKKCATYILNQ